MIGAFYEDRICSTFGKTVEEVESKIQNDKGHLPGVYILRKCKFQRTNYPRYGTGYPYTQDIKFFGDPVDLSYKGADAVAV